MTRASSAGSATEGEVAAAQAAFDELLPLYLVLWDASMGDADATFYASLARAEGSRPLVELGVGWARVARRTKPDVGVDFSAAMLDYAAAYLPRTTLVHADIASYSLAEPAALTYAAGNTFDNVVSDERLLTVLANVREQTKKGGRLVFDALHLEIGRIESVSGQTFHEIHGDYTIGTTYTLIDHSTGVYRLENTLRDNGMATAETRTFPPLVGRSRAPHQYDELLRQSGWTTLNTWSGFGWAARDESKQRHVWEVQR